MEFSEIIAGVGITVVAFIIGIAKLGQRLGWANGKNGANGSYNERMLAKMDSMISAQRQGVHHQESLLEAQHKTHEALTELCTHSKIDNERHGNIKEQLGRIESGIDDLKGRE